MNFSGLYPRLITPQKERVLPLQSAFFIGCMDRGFIKGRAPGKLTGCEHDFARLLYI